MSEENEQEKDKKIKGLEVNVTVEGKDQIERLQKELELKEAQEFLDDLRERIGKETGEDASTKSFKECKTYFETKQTKEFLEQKHRQEEGVSGKGASGKAPLSGELRASGYNKPLHQKEFSDYPSMIRELERLEKEGSPDEKLESKAYLDQMRAKALSGKGQGLNVEFEKGFGMNEFWEKMKKEKKEGDKE